MKKKFAPGKIPWDTIAEKVAAKMPPGVILGPALGEDAALVEIGGEVWAVASDPITFTSKEAGRLSVIVNANDIAVRGAKPLYYTVVVLVSPDDATEDYVSSILDDVRSTCNTLNIALIGGHTEVSPGLSHTIISGTMIGKVTGRPITTGGLREGDHIGMTKWAGLEGISILLNEFGERLREIHDSSTFDRLDSVFQKDWLSILPEAAVAAACPQVTSLHDVTEGGIGEALHEIATASGLHIAVDPDRIPLLPETRQLCADFGIDPLGLIGSGSLLIGCGKEAKEELEQALAEKDIPFSWIGMAEASTGKPSSSLPRFERDEILRAWLVEGMEACIFDMDGTLIDSEYDWHAIRTTLGVEGISIIDELNGLEGDEREAKWTEMRRIERAATENANLRPGATELITLLHGKRIKTALVTNNCDEHVAYLLEKFGLSFDVVISRDSGLYKPSGAPVAEAVRRLGVSPEKTLCVGDSPYDIMACRDSGCAWVCILFDENNLCNHNADLSFPDIHGLIRYLRIVG